MYRELQLGQLLLCTELRAVRILRCKMHRRSRSVQSSLRRPKIALTLTSIAHGIEARIGLPAWKQENQAAPVRERATFAQHTERIRRLPSARYSTQPHVVFPATVKPD